MPFARWTSDCGTGFFPITGGSRGLGFATAQALVGEGARVVARRSPRDDGRGGCEPPGSESRGRRTLPHGRSPITPIPPPLAA